MSENSALYIVSTPIGNLNDITLRALNIFKEVEYILCEDTRKTNFLLSHFDIKDKKLLIYNDHSPQSINFKILNILLNGSSVALVSDAGTPLISDPGYELISFLKTHNKRIVPIPGASAILSALSASGLACNQFLFLGFLPINDSKRKEILQNAPSNCTLVLYEGPSKIIKLLEIIAQTFESRKISLARELTKNFEQILTDYPANILKYFNENEDKIRGEFTICIEKEMQDDGCDELLSEIMLKAKKMLVAKISVKDVANALSIIYDINKKEIYQKLLEIK